MSPAVYCLLSLVSRASVGPRQVGVTRKGRQPDKLTTTQRTEADRLIVVLPATYGQHVPSSRQRGHRPAFFIGLLPRTVNYWWKLVPLAVVVSAAGKVTAG